jgi:hypothetical protein
VSASSRPAVGDRGAIDRRIRGRRRRARAKELAFTARFVSAADSNFSNAAIASSSNARAELDSALLSSFRSNPAQNARPAPVRMRTAGSRLSSSMAATNSPRNSIDSALSFSGRLSISTA